MDRTELYLKTAFCCMACDGDIAQAEIETIKSLPLFANTGILPKIADYTEQLKKEGVLFLKQYLEELTAANLTEGEECQVASVAVQTIEADHTIEYNEIAFFKKIRSRLHASDEMLCKALPHSSELDDQISTEDYFQPDIEESENFAIFEKKFKILR